MNETSPLGDNSITAENIGENNLELLILHKTFLELADKDEKNDKKEE